MDKRNIVATISNNRKIDATVAAPGVLNAEAGHSGGTNNYKALYNKPSIEDVILQGNKTFEELGMKPMTVQEIEKVLYVG